MNAQEQRVLIVEDNSDLRHLYKQVIELGGYETFEAGNGKEALEFLKTHPVPRAIILDLMMPIMDGWEFLRRCRNEPKCDKIPVIVCSATPDRIPEGVYFLRKPIDIDSLIRALDHA